MSLCRSLALACLFSTLVSPLAGAKALPPTSLPMVPGDLQSTPQGERIALQGGRSLLWPRQGPLTLQGPNDAVLFQVDLGGKAKRSSGAEALGLEVEETDLGGGTPGKKKYLSGKQAPTGRRLDSAALPGTPSAAEAGQSQRSEVGGIPITTTLFPNGASVWKIEWPAYTEEIYFDKKKSLVSATQTRQQGGLTASLQQYADGSYLRNYSQAAGTFRVTYDANDRSYRLSFANSQGDILAELDCGETCTED